MKTELDHLPESKRRELARVDDPIGGYVSDYDLLIVVNDEKQSDITDYWAKAEDQLLRDIPSPIG